MEIPSCAEHRARVKVVFTHRQRQVLWLSFFPVRLSERERSKTQCQRGAGVAVGLLRNLCRKSWIFGGVSCCPQIGKVLGQEYALLFLCMCTAGYIVFHEKTIIIRFCTRCPSFVDFCGRALLQMFRTRCYTVVVLWWVARFWFPPSRPCLLYTSPSPRDKRQSRMPSSA